MKEAVEHRSRKDVDHLTDEEVTTDSIFTLEIIIRKGDTPKDLIPEEFKETQVKDADKTSNRS